MALEYVGTGERFFRTSALPPIASFTMMAWAMLVTDTNTYHALMTFGSTSNDGLTYYVGVGSDGTAFYLFSGGADFTGAALPLGVWSHVAITVAGTGAGQFLGYLNGALAVTSNGNAALSAQSINWSNSQASSGVAYWPGRIAAAKTWSVALSASEIQQEMPFYLPLRTANLDSIYPWFDLTDQLTDYSGQSHTLTLVSNGLASAQGPPITWAPRSRLRNLRAPAATAFPRPPLVLNQAVARAAQF